MVKIIDIVEAPPRPDPDTRPRGEDDDPRTLPEYADMIALSRRVREISDHATRTAQESARALSLASATGVPPAEACRVLNEFLHPVVNRRDFIKEIAQSATNAIQEDFQAKSQAPELVEYKKKHPDHFQTIERMARTIEAHRENSTVALRKFGDIQVAFHESLAAERDELARKRSATLEEIAAQEAALVEIENKFQTKVLEYNERIVKEIGPDALK